MIIISEYVIFSIFKQNDLSAHILHAHQRPLSSWGVKFHLRFQTYR